MDNDWKLHSANMGVMQHFIRVYNVCYDKNNLQQRKYIIYAEIITCDPSVYTMDLLKFIVSNQ